MRSYWTIGINKEEQRALLVEFDNALSAEFCKDQLKLGGFSLVAHSTNPCQERDARSYCRDHGVSEIHLIPINRERK